MSLSIKEVKTKKKRNYYFTREVQDDIVAYNSTDDNIVRNKLYTRSIHQAFHRLCEAVLKTFKFTYTDGVELNDLIHEAEIHLFNNLHLFDPTRGTAYSYYSNSVKNFGIIFNTKNYKKLKETVQPVDVDFEGLEKQKYDDNEYDRREQQMDYFTDAFCDYLDSNMEELFLTRHDKQVAEAFIQILRNRDNLEIFDKKSFVIYIKDMTNVSESKILENFKIIKSKYLELNNQFEEYGFIIS
jgi:hypothetical protein